MHGLEPGHSKTMMAAYIVAIRGTIGQAILRGVCAALSHSLVVWIVAMVGLSLGREILNSHFEAWLLIASGVIILSIAAWMLWRTGQSLGWFLRRLLLGSAVLVALIEFVMLWDGVADL